jgi:Putative cyclase
VQDLEEVARFQGTVFKTGDILIIRTGFTETFGAMSAEQQELAITSDGGGCIGVEGSEKTARWIWNHHFAAVAGDATAFEAIDVRELSTQLGKCQARDVAEV